MTNYQSYNLLDVVSCFFSYMTLQQRDFTLSTKRGYFQILFAGKGRKTDTQPIYITLSVRTWNFCRVCLYMSIDVYNVSCDLS